VKVLTFDRYTLCCALAALLAGCGGSQPPIGAPGTMAQMSASATHADRGKSWMAPHSSSEDLIYATGGCGGTCVLSYPSGKLVGTVGTYGSAICSDSSGDVYITNDNEVVEYAHGGTSTIATYSLNGNQALGCSVDQMTGNIAVVYRGDGADIAVFPNGGGTPALYDSQLDSSYCGYDGNGNLFVNGYNGQQYGLSELPTGASEFTRLSINGSLGEPREVQWDGTYITWESGGGQGGYAVSRLQISGSTATVVGTTNFNVRHYATQSWIFGNRIIIPYESNGRRMSASIVGIWKYPKGDTPIKRFQSFGSYKKKSLDFQGVAFSV